MDRKINIEEVRGFLEASNKQFEQGGIYLERALFKRDDNGVLTGITLSYEDRTTSDTQETRKAEIPVIVNLSVRASSVNLPVIENE